jgi:hypothetical protein
MGNAVGSRVGWVGGAVKQDASNPDTKTKQTTSNILIRKNLDTSHSSEKNLRNSYRA